MGGCYCPAMILRVWALVALLLCSTAALAQECPLPPEAAAQLGQVDAASRLSFLRLSLSDDARLASRWRWGWVMGFGFVAVFNLGNGLSNGPALETHPADYVGAVTSALSTLPLIVRPLHVIHDGSDFGSRAATPEAGDTCRLIKEGEGLLVKDAENEAAGRSWLIQLANIVINVGAGAIVGFGTTAGLRPR